MQYLAPRQGLFAVIILVSFCFHVLFFVVNGQRQAKENYHNTATVLASELGQELKLPLAINDRVSASVIASRYLNNPAIAYIGIYDTNDRLIVPIGNENDSVAISQNIAEADKNLGKLVIQPTDVSRAKILVQFWLFLLISALLHAMIWMIYGYIARPSDELTQTIAKDVRDNLVASGIVLTTPDNKEPSQPKNKGDKPVVTEYKADNKRTVNEFLRELGKNSGQQEEAPPNPIASTEKPADTTIVQIAFIDKHGLFAMLEQEVKAAYLALCNQLIEKMLDRLLARPVLAGVQVHKSYPFELRDGVPMALVCFEKGNDGANIALAGAMLVKLIPLVNQVVYDRHREMGYFALPMKAVVSDDSRADAAWILLQKYHDPSLVLLNATDVQSIAGQMNLSHQKNASNIYERECRILTAVHDDMAAQLLRLRNEVLVK